jgi:hypothetical protein
MPTILPTLALQRSNSDIGALQASLLHRRDRPARRPFGPPPLCEERSKVARGEVSADRLEVSQG